MFERIETNKKKSTTKYQHTHTHSHISPQKIAIANMAKGKLVKLIQFPSSIG